VNRLVPDQSWAQPWAWRLVGQKTSAFIDFFARFRADGMSAHGDHEHDEHKTQLVCFLLGLYVLIVTHKASPVRVLVGGPREAHAANSPATF
jgi:hypothetical protein